MNRVSVIIPAHNVEEYISEAVESALQQTYPDVEVIVVNDGSTDGTESVLRPFIPRIQYIEQDNQGLSAARNVGIKSSTGNLIALLDADDLWMPGRLEALVNYMKERPSIGFSTTDAYLLKGDVLSDITYYQSISRRQRFRHRDQAYWILHTNFIFIMTLIRRELFDKHGYFSERLAAAGDWNLWIRFLLGGESVGFLDQPLAHYRVRPGSLSADSIDLMRQEVEALEAAAGTALSQEAERSLSGRVAFLKGKFCLANNEISKAKTHFREASRNHSLDRMTRLKALCGAALPESSLSRYRELRFQRRLTR